MNENLSQIRRHVVQNLGRYIEPRHVRFYVSGSGIGHETDSFRHPDRGVMKQKIPAVVDLAETVKDGRKVIPSCLVEVSNLKQAADYVSGRVCLNTAQQRSGSRHRYLGIVPQHDVRREFDAGKHRHETPKGIVERFRSFLPFLWRTAIGGSLCHG